jgi:hypothetical protein
MAKQRLFPEHKDPDYDTPPHEKFAELAQKVVTVPKAQIDKREQAWKRKRKASDV